MAWPYDSIIDQLETYLNLAMTSTFNANTESARAQTHWNYGDDHLAIEDLIDAVQYNTLAIQRSLPKNYYGYNGSDFAIIAMLNRTKACPFITEALPYDLTMSAVLSVMIASTFEDLQRFIGIVDAYRVALWNKPFNAEFYAALARGFEKWA